MKYMNNAEVGEIICNRDFVVKNNVIIVDRSNEEDMSDMPKGTAMNFRSTELLNPCPENWVHIKPLPFCGSSVLLTIGNSRDGQSRLIGVSVSMALQDF